MFHTQEGDYQFKYNMFGCCRTGTGRVYTACIHQFATRSQQFNVGCNATMTLTVNQPGMISNETVSGNGRAVLVNSENLFDVSNWSVVNKLFGKAHTCQSGTKKIDAGTNEIEANKPIFVGNESEVIKVEYEVIIKKQT